MIFIGGVRRCCGQRLDAWGPQAGMHRLSHIGYSSYRLTLTHGESGFWKCANTWLAGHTLARLSLCFMPRHFLVSYCLLLCLILDIMKICMDFSPYSVFPSFDIPEMVDQQHSWNSLVIDTYLLHFNEM
jgi:hypothetical protein